MAVNLLLESKHLATQAILLGIFICFVFGGCRYIILPNEVNQALDLAATIDLN